MDELPSTRVGLITIAVILAFALPIGIVAFLYPEPDRSESTPNQAPPTVVWTAADNARARAQFCTENPADTDCADARDVGPHDWYSEDVTHTECFKSHSPGERLKAIQDNGNTAKTQENRDPNGNMMSVEISIDDGEQEIIWTYYRHKDDCSATIERNHAVPSELK